MDKKYQYIIIIFVILIYLFFQDIKEKDVHSTFTRVCPEDSLYATVVSIYNGRHVGGLNRIPIMSNGDTLVYSRKGYKLEETEFIFSLINKGTVFLKNTNSDTIYLINKTDTNYVLIECF